jgi:dTDP-glucose 4,6-dehydratase
MSLLAAGVQRVLITGGAGFIGGAVIRRLLGHSDVEVYNLDKLGYASDLTSIGLHPRHHLLQVDLADAAATLAAVQSADPDLVMHLAAESHVDRSIDSPGAFVESNVMGTFHLLEAVRSHWQGLSPERRERFRFHHISTDEVFGSLGAEGFFTEATPYDPRSPYSASKAASDHLVRAWHHTYGLPVLLTNCSNNFGPWQFPEKLIPVVVLNALAGELIPLYGDGGNVRDWLFVEDHVDALLLVASKGSIGACYCVGGYGERSNAEVVQAICSILDESFPQNAPHAHLIQAVADRPGHDRRYAIHPARIQQELGWQPRHPFEQALGLTVNWYINNREWCEKVREHSGYSGTRLGLHRLVRSSS